MYVLSIIEFQQDDKRDIFIYDDIDEMADALCSLEEVMDLRYTLDGRNINSARILCEDLENLIDFVDKDYLNCGKILTDSCKIQIEYTKNVNSMDKIFVGSML